MCNHCTEFFFEKLVLRRLKSVFFLAIYYKAHCGIVSWKFTLLIDRPTYICKCPKQESRLKIMILKIWKNSQKSLSSGIKMWLVISNIWVGFERISPFRGERLIYLNFSKTRSNHYKCQILHYAPRGGKRRFLSSAMFAERDKKILPPLGAYYIFFNTCMNTACF